MAIKFPDGASFQFSTTFASAKTVSIFSNANPGVATATAHGYSDNDEVLYVGGWEDATDSVFRVNELTSDTLNLTGLDTSSTTLFPAGSGVGTLQKISSWQTIPQIVSISTSGGDARRATVNLLARRTPLNIPIGLNPVDIELVLAHDGSNSVYQTMLGISRLLTKCALKLVLADGTATYGYGNMVVGAMPNLQSGRENQVTVGINLLGRNVEYAPS